MNSDDRDILISRVIDGEASPEDWSSFKALAERDPSVWRELAGLQQDHAELSGAMARAMAIADGVEAPVEASSHLAHQGRVLRVWGGWAAAALMALAWFVHGPRANDGMPQGALQPTGNRAALTPFGLSQSSAPEDYFNAYLEAGQRSGNVLGEVGEPLLVQTLPHAQGGYEVHYIRQVLERRVVPQVYEISVGFDERGQAQPRLVPVRAGPGSM